jgi:hypothetical protein
MNRKIKTIKKSIHLMDVSKEKQISHMLKTFIHLKIEKSIFGYVDVGDTGDVGSTIEISLKNLHR